MRQEPLHLARIAVVPTLLVVLLALSLPSCLEPTSVECASGRVCPAGQRCSANGDSCLKTDCGDGIVQATEACDDGNAINGDGCSSDCRSNESCGNNIVDVVSTASGTKTEACDDGNTRDGDGCSADCLSNEFCGNGLVDTKVGETCDDGNKESNDGCSGDCLSNELCGNNYTDRSKGEVCDDGNNDSNDGCRGDCKSDERCGNSIVDVSVGEVCDDGNNEAGDGCSANCKSNEKCGNGTVDISVGEICDDSNQQDGDACSANCKGPGVACGNGKLDPTEQCDDGNGISTDDCSNDCKVTFCGDGNVDSTSLRQEKCDPKNDPNCNLNCTISACGDGIVNTRAGEVCDDGNNLPCGTCNSSCKQWQDLKPAKGSIINLPRDALNDGEKIFIHDGQKSVTFEFNKDDKGCSDNTRCVDIRNRPQPDEVADALAGEIRYSSLDIEVTSVRWNVINLENDAAGSGGNKPITDTVDHDLFATEGMAGGSGEGCGEGISCRLDSDCKSGLDCENGRCTD
ncbi:DUF4215 domain-containing protein [Archangium violaceum]|uniref:DUF4215 domain-containing protein n=1 Tax=Archangium violaceum TaxID=83451 RepID=UPI00194E5B10|nr:DUF4215 domain-containing protein [Archangium violaceum]QRN98391.1 DUF4215 domain-containing protein [Archangium violaceum]